MLKPRRNDRLFAPIPTLPEDIRAKFMGCYIAALTIALASANTLANHLSSLIPAITWAGNFLLSLFALLPLSWILIALTLFNYLSLKIETFRGLILFEQHLIKDSKVFVFPKLIGNAYCFEKLKNELIQELRSVRRPLNHLPNNIKQKLEDGLLKLLESEVPRYGFSGIKNYFGEAVKEKGGILLPKGCELSREITNKELKELWVEFRSKYATLTVLCYSVGEVWGIDGLERADDVLSPEWILSQGAKPRRFIPWVFEIRCRLAPGALSLIFPQRFDKHYRWMLQIVEGLRSDFGFKSHDPQGWLLDLRSEYDVNHRILETLETALEPLLHRP